VECLTGTGQTITRVTNYNLCNSYTNKVSGHKYVTFDMLTVI